MITHVLTQVKYQNNVNLINVEIIFHILISFIMQKVFHSCMISKAVKLYYAYFKVLSLLE